MTTPPSVAVVVPCFNEAGYVDVLLHGLLPQLANAPHWRLLLVDDRSTDDTPAILARVAADASAAGNDRVHVFTGHWGSPGGARSAGVAEALAAHRPPEWLVTIDADVEVAADWLAEWDSTFAALTTDPSVGAVNGVEVQDHLFAGHPRAAQVSAAFGQGVMAGERVMGPTNLNGVNHAVRASAYLTCGPYVQPTMPGPEGTLRLAGEDWDLGLRIRRAGFRVAETAASVHDRGRRLLADVHAYVSGEAYEGAFRRLPDTGASDDVPAEAVPALVDGAIERSLRHFLLKPLLAGVQPVAPDALSGPTRAAVSAWAERWPHPTFEESRNGFVFGRLPRCSDAVLPLIRADLGL